MPPIRSSFIRFVRAAVLSHGAAAASLTVGFLCCVCASARTARADTTHIVQRGHTIEAIAHRYHVTVKSIVEANKLADPAHLKPGQTLVIPGVDGKKKHGTKEKDEGRETERKPSAAHNVTVASLGAGAAPTPSVPGVPGVPGVPVVPIASPASPDPGGGRTESDTVHATRLGEDFHIRVKDARGHVPASAQKAFERLMREGNATHPVDPRLVSLVGIVSGHFGGRTIDVVSGYRTYKPTQYTPHSNHNLGRALDFRIEGVSDEALRDFCRTLRSAGCGFYPNGSFIHLDVRETKAYWVDSSRPGEPPKYDKAGTLADEGASDVPDDAVGANGSVTGESPGTGSGSTQPQGGSGVERPAN